MLAVPHIYRDHYQDADKWIAFPFEDRWTRISLFCSRCAHTCSSPFLSCVLILVPKVVTVNILADLAELVYLDSKADVISRVWRRLRVRPSSKNRKVSNRASYDSLEKQRSPDTVLPSKSHLEQVPLIAGGSHHERLSVFPSLEPSRLLPPPSFHLCLFNRSSPRRRHRVGAFSSRRAGLRLRAENPAPPALAVVCPQTLQCPQEVGVVAAARTITPRLAPLLVPGQ